MGPNWNTGEPVYQNKVNVTIVSNTQWDSDDVEKQKRYYMLKLHEEGHLIGRQHPDKTSPYPGRVANPDYKGYMTSSLWWDATLEDTEMNKANSLKATPIFLKLNEKRESDCTVLLGDPTLDDSEIKLYPNPAFNSVNLHDPEHLIQGKQVIVTDMLSHSYIAPLENNNTLNFENLPAGVYFISFPLKNGKMKSVKVVKI